MTPYGKFDGQKLRALRKERGLSMEGLCRLMALVNSTRNRPHRQSIWNWETGRAVPRVRHLMTLACCFDVDVKELCTGKPGGP